MRPQTNVYKVDGRTLSTYVDMKQKEACGEIMDAKVKIALYDYTGGKGDNGKFAYFNLDWKDARYLYNCIRKEEMDVPMERTKLHSMQPIKEGEHKGLYKVFKIYISYNKEKNGSNAKYPWTIQISNGAAERAPGKYEGAWYPKRGTYQEEVRNRINLATPDFEDLMYLSLKYIDSYYGQVAPNKIRKDLKTCEEANSNGYERSIQAEAERLFHDSEEIKNAAEVPAAEAPVEVPAAEEKKEPASNPKTRNMKMRFASGLQALEGNKAIAMCEAGNRTVTIFFDEITPEIEHLAMSDAEFNGMVYFIYNEDNEKEFHCSKVAS